MLWLLSLHLIMILLNEYIMQVRESVFNLSVIETNVTCFHTDY